MRRSHDGIRWNASAHGGRQRTDDGRRTARRDRRTAQEDRLQDGQAVRTVSVLIPAHNEAQRLAECLTAVQAQTRPVDQVVVVADNCTDDTAGIARSFGAVVVEAHEGAKAASQNVGLPHCTGDTLVCVDADTMLAPDVVELFLQQLDDGADATCANMLPMPHQRGYWVAGRRFAYALARYWWRWSQDQLGRLMVLSGCAYAMRTETVRALGGFPGQLITCDMDLTWELYGRGYRTAFCHKALAYTYDPETRAEYVRQMRRWASGFYQNFAHHRRLIFKSPASLLVVGGMVYDMAAMPVSYPLMAWFAIENPHRAHWVWQWFLAHAALTTFIASRTIGWRQALTSFPAYWTVNWFNKALYIWTGIREWVLGRHFASWTGRHGRGVEVTPMTTRRKLVLGGISTTAAATWALAAVLLPIGATVVVTNNTPLPDADLPGVPHALTEIPGVVDQDESSTARPQPQETPATRTVAEPEANTPPLRRPPRATQRPDSVPIHPHPAPAATPTPRATAPAPSPTPSASPTESGTPSASATATPSPSDTPIEVYSPLDVGIVDN